MPTHLVQIAHFQRSVTSRRFCENIVQRVMRLYSSPARDSPSLSHYRKPRQSRSFTKPCGPTQRAPVIHLRLRYCGTLRSRASTYGVFFNSQSNSPDVFAWELPKDVQCQKTSRCTFGSFVDSPSHPLPSISAGVGRSQDKLAISSDSGRNEVDDRFP